MIGAIVGCASLLACAGQPEDGDDEALSEEEIQGRMGLRLIYDAPSSSIRATLKRRLRAGEELRLRVRRGRLSSELQRDVSCRELPEAPPLPSTETASASAGGARKIVYQGPTIDVALLATVYDEQWLRENLTPQMLDTIAREGADAIVEACIMNGGEIRSRLQTSVAYAWDPADPNLAPHHVERLRACRVDASAAGCE